LLNFFHMLNMFSMQLDASQLAANTTTWKAMTLLINSDGSNVSQTHCLDFDGMLGSLFTFDTRVSAKVAALQNFMWMMVICGDSWKYFTSAPGGRHFIPQKRCRHFGQFSDKDVKPIWRCAMLSVTLTCALLTR
jgi:hypothetical protein